MASRRNPIRTVKIANAFWGGKAARDGEGRHSTAMRPEIENHADSRLMDNGRVRPLGSKGGRHCATGQEGA